MTSWIIVAMLACQQTPDISVLVPIAVDDSLLDGNYPFAVWWYRDALTSEPWNSNYAEGLALARSLVAKPSNPAVAAMLQPESFCYPGFLLHPIFMFVSYAAYVLLCVSLMRWRLTRRARWLKIACVLVAPALVAPVGVIIRHQRVELDRGYPYVVTQSESSLYLGNGSVYPIIAELPRGTEARLIQNSNEHWYQIELGNGTRGWIRYRPHLFGPGFDAP